MAATEPEINERLDSLARSMTEAALSSQGRHVIVEFIRRFSNPILISLGEFVVCDGLNTKETKTKTVKVPVG